MASIIALLAGLKPFAGIIGPFALQFLSSYLFKQGASVEDQNKINEIAGILRKHGMKNAVGRLEAESQIDAGADEWDAREAQTTGAIEEAGKPPEPT